MLNKYIVIVQELYEKKYLVKNAVAPQQAQEWIEIYIEDDLSDLLEENIVELGSNFVTEGRNNIAESLRDIKIKKLCSHTFCNCEKPFMRNNTEWLRDINPDVPVMNHMGCTCGYDEEETKYHEQETCCPDDKCDCGK